jgi:hypothetical protein
MDVHWQPDSELHLWIPLSVLHKGMEMYLPIPLLLAAGTWKQPPSPARGSSWAAQPAVGAVGGGPAAARRPQPVTAGAGKLKSGGPARGLGAGGYYMHNLNATYSSHLSSGSLNVPADLAL